ncbi:GIY-YIG nuclease family protein [Proteus terrae]|uniref:GIY-YIG nuclease family protein n=1 Tax=Proteus terrae TaxID=1574161 RepID=UPI0032DB7BAB
MSGTTIDLEFDGYWPIFNTADTINTSGIYCIYAMKKDSHNKLSSGRLIYVGEGQKVQDRLKNHNRLQNGQQKPLDSFLSSDEYLYYSVAPVTSGTDNRKRAEAALIFELQPQANTSNKVAFTYPETTIESSGKSYEIPNSFTVYKTN